MKLSVAMCTYNGARHLQDQLVSLAAQTRLPDELVVCDDQSADDTVELLRAFAAHAPFPIHIYSNEKNLGSTKNFERAIELCCGDIIALCDQDDVWHPAKLSRIAEVFASRPEIGMVFTDAEVVDEALRPLGYYLWQHTFSAAARKLFRAGKAFDVLSLHNIVTGATMAFRSKFKELVLPIPQHIALIHDGWIAAMIAATGATIEPLHEPLIKYRQHLRQQIGATPPPDEDMTKTFIDNLHFALRKKYAFAEELRSLETIYERASMKSAAFNCPKALESLHAKIAHYRTRANMPEGKLARAPFVFRELFTLRYHLYSKGTRSAVRDFLLTDSSQPK